MTLRSARAPFRPHDKAAPTGTVVALPLPASEEALVAALLAGRNDARDALFERYSDDVERVLHRILGPDSEAADLVQEVFVAALGSLYRLQKPAALRSWLCAIAVHKAKKLIRHRQRWRFMQSTPPDVLTELPAATPSMEVSEALRATYRVLGRLPVDQRIVFALRHIDGMELSAAAEACGVSLATVKRRLNRAQERFVRLAKEESALAVWVHPRSFTR